MFVVKFLSVALRSIFECYPKAMSFKASIPTTAQIELKRYSRDGEPPVDAACARFADFKLWGEPNSCLCSFLEAFSIDFAQSASVDEIDKTNIKICSFFWFLF